MTSPLYKDPDRARDLLALMTPEEKVAQLAGIWGMALISPDGTFNADNAAGLIPHGIGHISRAAASTLLPPNAVAALNNAIQRFLIEQTRLGIPAIVHEESCAGFLARGATTFPQAIGLAATWAPDLVEAMGHVIRHEMQVQGAHHTLAPVLDVARDPRWGRLEETFGEDPYLVSRFGAAYVRGVQGVADADSIEGVVCTVKHFVGYSLSEGGMNWAPAHIPERELREIFLTPFKAAVQEVNVRSVMNAYHELDGIPLGSHKALMVDVLRGEFGFDGVVASDYFTIQNFVDYHKLTTDKAEAALYGLEAGIDVELPAADCYGQPLLDGLKSGRVPMALVDQSALRVLEMKFQLGLFDNPYVDDSHPVTIFNSAESRRLSQTIAEKSLVLLKNDGLLPLSPSIGSVAVIGPHADSARLMQGDYHYPSHLEIMFTFEDAASDAPAPIQRMPAPPGDHFNPTVTIFQGMRDLLPDAQIGYARGCDVLDADTSGFAEAVELTRRSDVAVVCVGEKSGLNQGATSGESIDRVELRLPGVQQHLIEAIHATGKPVVVVLVSGRPNAIPWIAEHIPAVLMAWLPAQEGGTAVARALFGEVNPGGRLPVSVARSVGQIPVYYNHKPSGGRTHWQGSYVEMPATPLFVFGHGLSYTTFEYSDLTIDRAQVSAGETVTISATVRNTGDRVGDEVVQLYVHDVIASVTRPVKELKGFRRVTLEPGASARVTFHLPVNALAFYDREMRFIVEPGAVEVMIGASSSDIRLTGGFEITGGSADVSQVFNTPVQVN